MQNSQYRNIEFSNTTDLNCLEFHVVLMTLFQEFELKNKNVDLSLQDDSKLLYVDRRKLKKKKFEHVMALAANYVPLADQWFYEEIKQYHLDFVNPDTDTSCFEFEDNDDE